MWSSVLALAFLAALDPVRLGITLLVISRPRPVQNLLAYGMGCLAACIHMLVVPLMVLNFTAMGKSFTHIVATPETSSTARHVQIAMGVLALSIAALTTVRFVARRRAHSLASGGNTSTVVLDSETPGPFSRLLGRVQDAGPEGGSAIRRLLGRLYNAWENGSLWIAWVIGIGLGGPAPDAVVALFAVIMVSGAAIGAQISAAITLIVGMLAVVEIVLVGCLAKPAKTQALLRLLHDWVGAHRPQILVAASAVVGVSLLANGMGMGVF